MSCPSPSSRVENELEEFDRLGAWPIVFQKMRNESLFEAEEFSLRAARNPLNRNLNRYRDVAPYDHSRILLKEGETDYINASLVEGCALATPTSTPAPPDGVEGCTSATPTPAPPDGVEGCALATPTSTPAPEGCALATPTSTPAPPEGQAAAAQIKKEASPDLASPMEPSQYRRYILTQGPLHSTACHFWQMVWEQKSLAVVMLNKVMEKGVTKCAQYWPNGEANGDHESYLFEETGFRVTLLRQEEEKYFTIRRLAVEHLPTGAERQVLHFHYTTWPDFGVPDSPSAFLHFLLAVRQSGALEQDVGPPIVHCSAGIGRSGTFCLVDSALVQIEAKKSLDVVDVTSLLMHMRRFRMGLIQTFDQLRFSYIAIIEGGHRLLLNQFSREELAAGQAEEEEEDEEDEDMEEEDDDDDSDQSESEEEDEVAAGYIVSVNPEEEEEEDDEDDDDLPDISPPPPPKRVESLSPASERKFLLQAAARAAEAGRPVDGSDNEETSQALPPLPKKHNMGLSMNKIARPGSTDTLSIDEGFVDLNTPGTEGDPPSTLAGNINQIRKRATTTTSATGQSSFDSSPEEEAPPPTTTTTPNSIPTKTKEQQQQQQKTDEKPWKWLLLPLPVLFLGYFVYKCYYS